MKCNLVKFDGYRKVYLKKKYSVTTLITLMDYFLQVYLKESLVMPFKCILRKTKQNFLEFLYTK